MSLQIHTHIHRQTQTYACIYVSIQKRTHLSTYTHTHTHMNVRLYDLDIADVGSGLQVTAAKFVRHRGASATRDGLPRKNLQRRQRNITTSP